MSKRHPLPIILTFIVAMGLSSCSHKGKQNDFQSLLASAKNYESSGQYRAAIIEIRKAMQMAPADPGGPVMLARIYNDLGQSRQAIDLLKTVKSDSPDYVMTLARAYVDLGKYRSARDFLKAHAGALDQRPVVLHQLRGDLALADGKFEEATKEYQAILSSDAGDRKALLGVARVAAAQGHLHKATATLQKILEKHPNDARALLYLSVIRTRNGDLPGAEELLTKAASATAGGDLLTPLRYSILVALRDNLTKQGKTSDALVYSQLIAEATQNSKDIDDKVHAAVDAAADSNFERARKLLTQVQSQVPDSERAGTMLGVVDYLQGDNKAAVKQFEKFVDPEVASPQALQMFAMAELKLNHPEQIIKRLQKDIDDKKDGRVVALYGIALVSAGETEKGETYLEKAIKLNPKNPRLRLPLVRLLNDAGKHDQALAQLRAAFKAKPTDPLVDSGLVQQLMRMGKKADADTVVADLRKSYPDSVPSQLVVADYYASIGKAGTATEVLEGLSGLNQSPEALGLLATLELRTGQYHQAAQRFRQIIKLNPKIPRAYKGLITAFELEKKPEQGVAAVKDYANSGESDVPLLVLSEYYGRKGKYEEAFATLAKVKDPKAVAAIELKHQLTLGKAREELAAGKFDASRKTILAGLSESPENPRLLGALVNVELAAGKTDEATKVLARLRKAEPDAPLVSVLAGDIEMKQNKPGSAKSDYEAAWQKAPSDIVALKLYTVLRKLPDTNEAKIDDFFRDWARKIPGSVSRQIAQAGYAMSTGKMSAARSEYEAVLAQHPNTVIALNNLAWIYGDKDVSKALKVSQKAYKLAPQSGPIADTYGWFLYKSGNSAQAKEILARAVQLSPGNAEIQQHYDTVSGTAAHTP